METTAKAYGKILVFGAYSILEPGNIGLVANVDKGTKITVTETDSGRIVFDLKNFKISVYGRVKGHKLKLEKNPEELKFIKSAVERTFEYLKYKRIKIKDVSLLSINDPELYLGKKQKTGLGSSATATVATVAAMLEEHGINDKELVYKISRYAHYKSQGKLGSGFDIASACHGSHFFISEEENLDREFIEYVESDYKKNIQEFYWPLSITPIIAFTGKAASTPKLVNKVLKFKKHHLEKYNEFMKEYNTINLKCQRAFQLNNVQEIVYYLEKSWDYRKKLGEMANARIEPRKITKLLETIKKEGVLTAGLLGAGGGDSIIALYPANTDKEKILDILDDIWLTVFDDLKIVSKPYEFLT